MRNICQLAVLVLSGFFLSACGGSESDPAKSVATNSASSDSARFSKDMGRGCDLMPAELVSATFQVPVDSLMQMKIMGCHYAWSDDVSELKANIMMIRVHKSEAAAATWFGNSTKSRTAEEMQAEMQKVAERLKKRTELDTDNKKSLAKGILKFAGRKAVVFEDVTGVGDEARISADGNISVRVDNLTFALAAYHGPKPPSPEMAGLDVQQMIAAAQESAGQWTAQTLPQRERDGAKLAQAVVEEL